MIGWVEAFAVIGVYWVFIEVWIRLCAFLGFPFAKAIRTYSEKEG